MTVTTVRSWRTRFEQEGLAKRGKVWAARGLNLFAALDVLAGTVIGQCLPPHRHQEFLKFLRTVERETPKGLQVHLVCNNYATHKLDRHRRGHPRQVARGRIAVQAVKQSRDTPLEG